MSQAGIVDFLGTHPQISTLFVANVGTAIPIANTIEILGNVIAAHSVPLQTTASGNTININVQFASAAASSVGTNAGVASFNSTQFTVDANGFVSLSGGAFVQSFTVDTSTPPGTNPVTANGSGIVTVTGGQVAAGTTTNVIRTASLAANSYTIQIQRSQAVAASTVGDNGVSHFNSTYFTVDSNGFVSLNGSGVGETITGNTGGALSPTGGNWNILGTSTAAGATPVQTSGTGSTLTVQVQKSQAIASTNATNVGLAAFNSSFFTVDANGFVSLSGTGTGQKITGNTGGALSPTAGNWNIVGSGSLTTSGSGSTLTVQITGITNHAVQVGGSGTTLTQVGPSATTGAVLASNGAAADPSFQTIASLGGITSITGNSGGAEVPLAGNFNILGTGSITIVGSANTETVQLTGLTKHSVLVGSGTATITNISPSATAGVPLISNGSLADPSFGTAVVAGGGTGLSSMSTYQLLAGGTTSTGNVQQVASTGTSGQVLTSAGAGALPTWNTTAGGKLVLISSQTASSSANIVFTGLTIYTNYFLLISNCKPATNAQALRMEVSQNNGSTYLSSGYTGSVNYTPYNSSSITNSNSTSIFPLSGPVSNVDIYSSNIYLQNVNLGDPVCVEGMATWFDTTLSTTAIGTIGGQTSTGINAIRLSFASGNITQGTFSLYGYATS